MSSLISLLLLLLLLLIVNDTFTVSLQIVISSINRKHISKEHSRVILSASTAAKQYALAKSLAAKELRQEAAQRTYHAHLNKLADGDDTAIGKLGSLDRWRKYASAGITISENGYEPITVTNDEKYVVLNSTYKSYINETLDKRGFAVIPRDNLQWDKFDVDMTALAETMDRLTADGFPPVFIFLFDQAWKLSYRLFDLMAPVLNDPEAVLEASMYAWSLSRQVDDELTTANKEKVGSNFGVPHRDITYKNCHNPADGSPDILSLWIPLVDIGDDNGCMYVVPRERDAQFSVDNKPSDQDPFSHRFPYSDIKPLCNIKAGTTLVWHPNLIHYGSGCSSYSPLPPRKSIAMAFRVRDTTRPSTNKEVSRYGRLPYKRHELITGPTYKERLRMIAKALMLYNVWYPEYDGLDLNVLTNEK